MEIGEKIKNARELKNMTQFDLAVASGVQPNTIGNWERGVTEPSKPTLMALSHILETDLL